MEFDSCGSCASLLVKADKLRAGHRSPLASAAVRMRGMTRRDQSLIAFMVATFCFVVAVNGLFNIPGAARFGVAVIMSGLGVSCLWAGISLRRDPPA